LIGPGDRKSVQPMAERLATGNYDQLHHFIADGVWDATPLESELLNRADQLVGGKDAVLVIDDTAMPKKGDRSVGVAAQYASSLGKTANCQTLVSLTLARGEVPVMIALRLFLPESWTTNVSRLKRARVEQFWVDTSGTIYFQLRYGKQPLELEKGKSTLKASNFDDLVEQLDQIKTLAVGGAMDDALAACANAVKSNFKAARDKSPPVGANPHKHGWVSLELV
jgi:hypothetical protein